MLLKIREESEGFVRSGIIKIFNITYTKILTESGDIKSINCVKIPKKNGSLGRESRYGRDWVN